MTCNFISNASVLRFTRLDNCGKPVSGATNGFVTECFASVAMAPNTDEQDDKLYKAANGKLCAFKKGCLTLLGYDVTITLEFVSPELIDILTQQPVVLPATGTVPVGWDDCSIPCNGGFGLEIWTELLGEPCPTSGNPQFLYTLLPWIQNGYIGDIELGSETVNLEITGATRAGGAWDVGPYLVTRDALAAPSKMLTPLGATCHRRNMIVDVAPPTATCTYQTVTFP
jgi:hypothetical protein